MCTSSRLCPRVWECADFGRRWAVNRGPACGDSTSPPSGSRAAVWYLIFICDTSSSDHLHRVFLLHLFCFHSLPPSSPITPRLLSAPLLRAPTGCSAASPVFACWKTILLLWVIFIYFIIFAFWGIIGAKCTVTVRMFCFSAALDKCCNMQIIAYHTD